MKTAKRQKVLKALETVGDLLVKCGGPGGTPGPCPTGKKPPKGEGKPSKEERHKEKEKILREVHKDLGKAGLKADWVHNDSGPVLEIRGYPKVKFGDLKQKLEPLGYKFNKPKVTPDHTLSIVRKGGNTFRAGESRWTNRLYMQVVDKDYKL